MDSLPPHQKPIWEAFRRWIDKYGDCISLNENEEYQISDEMWLFWNCFLAGSNAEHEDTEE